MTNIFVRFFITLFLSFLLITSSSLAFHKKNSQSDNKKTDWDGSKEAKKISETIAKQDFCALSAKGITVLEDGDPITDLTTGEQRINEETGKPEFDQIEVNKIRVTGYHSADPRNTGGVLIPTPSNGLNFNVSQDWGDIKLVTVLKMYCLQLKTEDRPNKFKGSYLEDFYKLVAAENGYLKADGVTGDYNKKLMEGPDGRGPIEGRDILKDGIIISNPDAVWYLPDFLIKQDLEIKQAIKQKKEAEAAAKKKAEEDRKKKERKQARIKAERDGNEQWISENKQNYIDLFGKKLKEYENKIDELETKRNNLKSNLDSFENLMSEAEEDAKNTIADIVNRDNQEIKDLRETLRNYIKEYLKKNDLEGYKSKFKKIEKVNFNKYKNFTTLKTLIERAENSNKAKDFVGKDGFKITLPKILGGKTKKITGDKIGFIQEFKNIEKRDLGSGSDEDLVDIKNLNKQIQDHSDNIKNYVNFKVDEIKALDEELGQRIPWKLISIGFVIVIIVIGVGVYLYFQRKEMDQLKREAEEKVGSLKNEFEGKLKSTSEQIKSAARNTQRSQQTSLENQEVIQEKPKTPEQIIAEKYDELVSDYKESLDDFTKVAGFKQKWHGLALSRKERQEGTKTILVNSSRAFEKAEIWCVTFSDKYFAFPGSTVKSNMATYMNLDFEKASRDFKGVFSVSTGSSYTTEPCVLRRGGAGFVVERVGKIIFPN